MKRFSLLAFAALSASTARADHPILGFDDNVAQNGAPAKGAAPMAPPVVDAPIAGAMPTDNAVFPEFIRPRGSIRADFGNGVGYDNGYTYVESFLPLWQDVGRWLLFNNMRVVNFQNAELWEINAGFGLRRYNADTERILGVHASYDGRTTASDNYYNQITVGWESLGQRFDVRNNFYIPVGNRINQVGDSGAFDPRFQGYNIIFSRTRVFEAVQGGLDFEAGGLLPYLEQWAVRGYLGYYHYAGEGLPSIDGARARLEANVNDSMTLHFMVQNDAVNNTMVSGGLAYHFGPGKAQRGVPGASPYARMGERVVRDPDIAVNQQSRTAPEVALDAVTGNPILVRHAASYANVGGDGTVERPYQTLSALQAGSTPRDILFVHANSVFNNQSITLQNNQRFLGEGLNYYFASKQGTFLLPRATDGTILPTVRGSAGDMVTLANSVEVAGFTLQDAGRNSIFGSGVSDVFLHDLALLSANRNAVRFVDVGGVNSLQNLTIAAPGRNGVSISQHGAVAGSFLLDNVNVANTGGSGLRVRTADTSAFTGVIANSSFTNSAENGIYFSQRNQSTVNATIQNSTFTDNVESHISVRVENQASPSAFTILGNTMLNTFDTGLRFAAQDRGSLAIDLGNNTVRNNAIFGMTILQDNRSQVAANIHGNTFERNGIGHIGIDTYGQSTGSYTLTGNVLSRTFGNGLYLGMHNNTVATLNMTGNQINRSLISGALVQMDGKSNLTAVVDGNVVSQNLIFGMAFLQANQSNADVRVLNNQFTNNGFIHALVDLKNQSTGSYLFQDNTATGGFGASLVAAAENKSTMFMRLQDNTTDRPAFLFSTKNATFDLSLSGNTLNPPAFAFIDPSINIVP